MTLPDFPASYRDEAIFDLRKSEPLGHFLQRRQADADTMRFPFEGRASVTQGRLQVLVVEPLAQLREGRCQEFRRRRIGEGLP